MAGKNRYKKILKHLKSEEIDCKINFLNEKMTTSGLYLSYGMDSGTPAVPEVPAIPAVPPTYDNVTGGLSNANDFVWPDQGDGSNPDATTSIPSNLYTTYNGQQVAATRYIDTYNGNTLDYGDYPPIGALVFKDGWLGWNYLGYLSGSGIRSVGTTRFPNGDIGNAINAAYNNWPFPGLISKTIYQWEPLDCLFGSCKGASQYYPAGRTTETTPKADRALYAYTLWIPADANGNPLPNRIMTNAGSPEVPAIPGTPAIPPKQVIIGRSNIGDPNYYPGPATPQGDIAQMGPNQVYPLLDIIRQSPPGPTRDNAIRQLDQWAKPGSKNRDILIKLGVPLQGASLPTNQQQIAQIQPAQQQRGATGVGVPDTTGTSPGSNLPPSSQMNYPKEWLPKGA